MIQRQDWLWQLYYYLVQLNENMGVKQHRGNDDRSGSGQKQHEYS